MKRLIQRLAARFITIGLAAALCGCAGEDDKLYPIDGPTSFCSGVPMGSCDEIDPELCIGFGCELRRDGAVDHPRCTGDLPSCESMSTPQRCAQIRGCGWAA
jgi:hypothetical protein